MQASIDGMQAEVERLQVELAAAHRDIMNRDDDANDAWRAALKALLPLIQGYHAYGPVAEGATWCLGCGCRTLHADGCPVAAAEKLL